MLGQRLHRQAAEFVEPDLPITPMLDMSFQLLAFFIMTFQPGPTEGQIEMTLPKYEKKEGGGSGLPNPLEEIKSLNYIVTVIATKDGKIESMSIREEKSGIPESKPLPSLDAYQKELKSILSTKPADKEIKLTLKIGPKLLQAYVIQLMDAAVVVGFTDIAPELLK